MAVPANVVYSSEITSSDNHFSTMSGASGLSFVVTTVKYFGLIASSNSLSPLSTTESDVKYKSRTPFTLSDFSIVVQTNTITATSTFNFRKNGANGNETLSVGSSATGTFHDTTNTDSIASSDEINIQANPGGTGSSMTLTSFTFLGLLPSGVTVASVASTLAFMGAG